MKLGDFSSLVQLGVGIHAGTAFFNMLSEFQLQPIENRIRRVKAWLDDAKQDPEIAEMKEKLNNIISSINVCKIQHFNEYKKIIEANFFVGGLLLFVLIYSSFDPNAVIEPSLAALLSLACWYPAFWSFIRLWTRVRDAIERPVSRLEKLEAEMRGETVALCSGQASRTAAFPSL